MTAVSLAASAVVVPMVTVELTAHRVKLQTGLTRVLVVWAAAFAAVAGAIAFTAASGLPALAIFWFGVFLSWFGVRSHIESSILLRMLYLLHHKPMTDAELLAAYLSHYGESARVEELQRAGLIAANHDVLFLTKKGKAVLTIVSRLR